jgi:hypothetical protein
MCNRLLLIVALAAGLMLAIGGPASAQGTDSDGDTASGNWDYSVGLYFWIPVSLDGTSTVSGIDAPVDLALDDILDLFEAGIAGRFEAWHQNRWGVILDGYYADLGTEVATAGPQFNVDITEGIVDIFGAHRLTPDSDGLARGGTPGASETAVDIMVGGRYHYLKQEIDIIPGPLLGGSHDWFELAVGARVQWGINERWSTGVRADFSGFGIGDASDLTYNLWATANYHPWERWALLFGYRVYGLDYETGAGLQRFGMDVTEHGPFIAVGYQF